MRIVSAILAVLVACAFAYALWEMQGFRGTSRLMPGLAIYPGLALSLLLIIQSLRALPGARLDGFREHHFLLLLVLYPAGVWAFGYSVPTLVMVAWMLLACAGMRPLGAVLYGGAVFGVIYWLYGIMRTDMPTGRIIDLF